MSDSENIQQTIDPDFERIVTGPDDEINLAEAALLIARSEYPGLDIDYYLGCLDDMAAGIAGQLPDSCPMPQMLGQINHYLFNEQGYSGNLHNFLDPRNSFLNDVLERKLGIPISLSILYMEIGRRLGLSIEGISFPGHFLIKLPADDGDIVLDPFAGGVSLDESDLKRRLQHVNHAHSSQFTNSLADLLQAASNRAILARILRNLKSIYSNSGDRLRMLRVLNYLLAVIPDEVRELRARGELYEQLQCYRAALDDLERVCLLTKQPGESEEIASRCTTLRRRAGLLH